MVIYEGHVCELGFGIFAWKVNLCSECLYLQRPTSLAVGTCSIWFGNIWKKQCYPLRIWFNCQFTLTYWFNVLSYFICTVYICLHWGIYLHALEAPGELRLSPYNCQQLVDTKANYAFNFFQYEVTSFNDISSVVLDLKCTVNLIKKRIEWMKSNGA